MTFNPIVDYSKPTENENEHTKMLQMVSEMQKLWSEFALLLSKQSSKQSTSKTLSPQTIHEIVNLHMEGEFEDDSNSLYHFQCPTLWDYVTQQPIT
jgi:hypothetical protein